MNLLAPTEDPEIGNRGRWKKWERDNDSLYRFDDYDRKVAFAYFRDHRYRYEDDHGGEWSPEGVPIASGYVRGPGYRVEDFMYTGFNFHR